ncbi:hypothetical protein [Thauera sp.]|uniref:hypothetical protein n=1 Tax=Thauera sp. TaxID=1905334 RepID=UPI0039E2E7F4
MSSILYVRAVGHEFPSFLQLPEAQGVVTRHVRELGAADFARFDVIIVPAHIDQRAFAGHSAELERFLDKGGTLVFNGHLVYPVLPELAMFVQAAGSRKDDLLVERTAAHPVFDGVDVHDLSFRRGVAGFYGRGANPPPPGAIVLHRLKADRSPVNWYWERPQGGRILMHSGNPLWMYVNDDTSAARIAPQLLRWLKAGIHQGA